MLRRGLALTAVLLILALVAACGGTQPADDGGETGGEQGGETAAEPIVIGLEGPMTGDYAAEGDGFTKAVTMLVDQINADGGVLGRQIKLEIADDKGTAKDAALAAQNLISKGAVAVIGAYNSTATEAAMGPYHEEGVLHLTPSSTATHLTEKGYQNFFRVAFLDSAQGLFAANLLVDKLGAEKVALVHDNSTYAAGLAEWTKKFLEEKGAEVVFYDALNPKDTDFSSLVTNLKSANPDAIYFTGYFSQAGLLVKQAREQGIEVPFAGGNATNNHEVIDTAGEHAEGFITTTEPLPADLPYPEAEEFVADYRAKYNEEPVSIWTAMAADSLRIIVEAMEQTQSTDMETLANYLRDEMDGFAGITGPVTFDEKGDREGTVYAAYRIENGEFVMYVTPDI